MPRNRDEMALLRRPRSSSRRQDRTASIEQSGLLWAASRGQCPRISPSAPGNLDKLPTSWSTQICSDLFRSVCVRVSSRWRDGESKADRAPPRAPRVPRSRAPHPGRPGHGDWTLAMGFRSRAGAGKPVVRSKKKTRPSLTMDRKQFSSQDTKHHDNLSLLAVCHGTLLDGLPAACPSRSRLPRHTRGCWLTTWQRPCYSVPPSQAPPVGALQKWGRGRQHTLGLDQINLLLQRPGG